MNRASAFLLISFLASDLCSQAAPLKLPAIFGDNMVLQQQTAVPVWGWAEPGATVTVRFEDQVRRAHADANGRWRISLGKLKATAVPQTLSVESGVMMTLTNVLVGEVWLCSGQSNMEKPIPAKWGEQACLNAPQELAAANYPQIRLFQVEKVLSATPLDDLKHFRRWRECNSNALDSISFSAAAYFFGREIHTNLNVPVGLIESSWGGTMIEPWTPPAGFRMVPSLARLLLLEAATNKISVVTPSVLYNAMISPLVGFGIRGALWYQGESNCLGQDDESYSDKMTALVGGWRKLWCEGDFPFYFVQIAPFKYTGTRPRRSSPEVLPVFWTVQSRAARQIRNAGMAVTTDLVDDIDNIHPRDKQDVGHRLALIALNKTYGKRDVVCSGPAFRSVKIEGDKAVLTFDHADGGLMSKDGRPLSWFTIAGADGKFVRAEAAIVGNAVTVSASGVDRPAAVRFAWDETAQPNFFNRAGLPCEPFRTDDPLK